MPRDYAKAMRSPGVWIPRWLFGVILFLILVWILLRIMIPPSWIVQRLDSPDGERAAMLLRNRYLDDTFSVQIKQGIAWRTVFYSPSITNDFRVDLGERLWWAPDSRHLVLYIGEQPVWAYDARQGAAADPRKIVEAEP